MKKIVRKFNNAMFLIEIILLLSITLLNYVPFLFQNKPYVVMSGSMEPVIHVGSMAYVNRGIESEDIKVGDIITFNINLGTYVTHRVVEIDSESKYFITKGDANDINDAPVPFDNFIGKTEFSIPYFGYVMDWLANEKNKIILIGVFISQTLLNLLLKEEKEGKPFIPSKPNAETGNSDIPNTGDRSYVLFWTMMLLGCGIVISYHRINNLLHKFDKIV